MKSDDTSRKVVVRVAGEEDRHKTDFVRWSVGWESAPTTHRIWPMADEEWLDGNYFCEFVAEVDGVVAGRVGLEAFYPPFAQMVDLAVRPDYRRRGIGKQLMRACFEAAGRRGFSALFLQTETDNLNAHQLYHSLGFVPTAYGRMLRMVKFLDYPLVNDFINAHPLAAYWCEPGEGPEREWTLQWKGYISDDYLRLAVTGGSCQSESDGMAPSLPHAEWYLQGGDHHLSMRIIGENVRDVEPGNHIEVRIVVQNLGEREEYGALQMCLPPGVSVRSPESHQERVFIWGAQPGTTFEQTVIVQIGHEFNSAVLRHLNYSCIPVGCEVYWENHRALLSSSLHMAAPLPRS